MATGEAVEKYSAPSGPCVNAYNVTAPFVTGNLWYLPSVVIRATPPTYVNQTFASAPVAMPYGDAPDQSAYWVTVPWGVISATKLPLVAANHSLPFGPAVISAKFGYSACTLNSVISPLGVMRPTSGFCRLNWVNQTSPSLPGPISSGDWSWERP